MFVLSTLSYFDAGTDNTLALYQSISVVLLYFWKIINRLAYYAIKTELSDVPRFKISLDSITQ